MDEDCWRLNGRHDGGAFKGSPPLVSILASFLYVTCIHNMKNISFNITTIVCLQACDDQEISVTGGEAVVEQHHGQKIQHVVQVS